MNDKKHVKVILLIKNSPINFNVIFLKTAWFVCFRCHDGINVKFIELKIGFL